MDLGEIRTIRHGSTDVLPKPAFGFFGKREWGPAALEYPHFPEVKLISIRMDAINLARARADRDASAGWRTSHYPSGHLVAGNVSHFVWLPASVLTNYGAFTD